MKPNSLGKNFFNLSRSPFDVVFGSSIFCDIKFSIMCHSVHAQLIIDGTAKGKRVRGRLRYVYTEQMVKYVHMNSYRKVDARLTKMKNDIKPVLNYNLKKKNTTL